MVKKIITDSLEEEVTLIIKEILTEKNLTDAIDENIKLFKSGKFEQMHKDLQKIGLSITYAMG